MTNAATQPPVEGVATRFCTANACAIIRKEIAEARGTEVFFVGRRDQTGLVTEVEAKVYGNDRAVAVVFQNLRCGDVIIHNHPSGNLQPSDADLAVSQHVSEMGVGSYICDNNCDHMRVIIRPHEPADKKPLHLDEVKKFFQKNSNLSNQMDFEERPQQMEMARSIADAFNNEGISVIEAGTGTGKSLAYLIPALLYALENDERVIISTNTINLQEQILHKDLPVVQKVLNKPFRAELVKGRSNYVCKRKAQFAREELASGQLMLIEEQGREELSELLAWTTESKTGDRTELTIQPRQENWERVVSETDNCLRMRCPFYDECFYYNSRRLASRANVLVVNHSLLLSDASVRRESNNWSSAAVLPPSKFLILDEAHHLEESATRHLATSISRFAIRRLFQRLYRNDMRGRQGVLSAIADRLESFRKRDEIPGFTQLYQIVFEKIIPRTEEVKEGSEYQIDDVAHIVLSIAKLEMPRQGVEEKLRITEEFQQDPRWREEVRPQLQAIVKEYTELVQLHRVGLNLVQNLPDEEREEILNFAMEWRAIVGRLELLAQTLVHLFSSETEYCRWVEFSQDRKRNLVAKFCSSPIDVAEVLRECIHEKTKTEILTSATLTVGKDFNYFLERTGLRIHKARAQQVNIESAEHEDVRSARPLEELKLDSPFDYKKQVFFGIPNDLGDVRQPAFERNLCRLVVQAIHASGGRAFILFTSYRQMQSVFNQTAQTLHSMGIDVYRQGQEPRTSLLQKFRQNETSVLFATSSFWEGVDVQGRALELLILAKLPFTVPNDPVAEAQYEHMKAQGRDPFNNLVVPRAIVRFKQGFGRLIRSKSDRGAVIVADERIKTMTYGRRFLDSLPPMNIHHEPTAQLAEKMSDFFKTK